MSTRPAAGYRQLTDAIVQYYGAAAPPPPDPAERPSWATPGYQPLDDTSINAATREARHSVLTGLALADGFAKHHAAAAARKAAREGGTTDPNGEQS